MEHKDERSSTQEELSFENMLPNLMFT